MPSVPDVGEAHLACQDIIWSAGGQQAKPASRPVAGARPGPGLADFWAAGNRADGVSAGSLCWHVASDHRTRSRRGCSRLDQREWLLPTPTAALRRRGGAPPAGPTSLIADGKLARRGFATDMAKTGFLRAPTCTSDHRGARRAGPLFHHRTANGEITEKTLPNPPTCVTGRPPPPPPPPPRRSCRGHDRLRIRYGVVTGEVAHRRGEQKPPGPRRAH